MPSLPLIILLLTVALPLLEIALLIKAGTLIGVWPVLAIIVGTAIAGITVVRHQGIGVARRMVATVRSGEPPVEPVMEAMLLMLAGTLLILPGLITDAVGLILLVPFLRQWAARQILKRGVISSYRVERRTWRRQGRGSRPPGSGPTIEGEYERLDETPAPPPTGSNPRDGEPRP